MLRVRSSLNVTRARIGADDYAHFRAFLMEVDAALASPIAVAPPAPAGGIVIAPSAKRAVLLVALTVAAAGCASVRARPAAPADDAGFGGLAGAG